MWKSFSRIGCRSFCNHVFSFPKEVLNSRLINASLIKYNVKFKDNNATIRIFTLRTYGTLCNTFAATRTNIVRNRNIFGESSRNVAEFQHCHNRHLRTSSKSNSVPAFVVVMLSKVAKWGGVIVGRFMRVWWKKLPPEEKAVFARKVQSKRHIIAGLLGASGLGLVVYYETHLQETPVTHRKRFIAFTNSQIMEMAQMELEVLLRIHENRIIAGKTGDLGWDGPRAVYYKVLQVAQRLINANQDLSQIRDLEWTVTVVDDDSQMNALVLPCGSIFVFSGLVNVLVDSDDQLGVILAHEMAHAVMGHGAEKASFMTFLDWMFVIPLAALWAIMPTDIMAALAHWITSVLTDILMDLPHSRFIEDEADQVGLVLAAKACFDIREAPVIWAKLQLMGKGAFAVEWLSTHPSNKKRQARLEAMIPDALKIREQSKCPPLPQQDPRLKIDVYQKVAKLRKDNVLIPIKFYP